MKRILPLLAAAAFLPAFTSGIYAKDKPKPLLPTYVMRAQTVAVLIDPEAGVSLSDPNANETARKDVEAALLEWGRLQPVLSARDADIVILVRRGNGKMVNPTVTNPHQNGGRPGSVTPYDSGIAIGAQHGQPRPTGQQSPMDDGHPHSQTEITNGADSFIVYEGGIEDPLDATPAWRYSAKDALRPHSVPAVAEFKRAFTETEKALAEAQRATQSQP